MTYKTARLQAKKRNGHKITALTCYDYSLAKQLAKTRLDLILVGDSLGMVVYGDPDTHAVTMAEMVRHTQAVARAQGEALLLADMPAGSYDTPQMAVRNARQLIEAGAEAVKLEGGKEILPSLQAVVAAGIDVVGHLGLTPQTATAYRVQGRDKVVADRLREDALLLSEAGVIAVVLEMMSTALAAELTQAVSNIPTIGIGAGPKTDGQILVLPDMLGLFEDFKPRFVERFGQLGLATQSAVQEYIDAVESKLFPNAEHSYD